MRRRRQHHRRRNAPPRHLTPLTRRAARRSQDDAKEAHTTTEILTEVAVEEILSLKKAEDEHEGEGDRADLVFLRRRRLQGLDRLEKG